MPKADSQDNQAVTCPLLGEFQDYLKHERHFSPYTARCYSADLRQYFEHLDTLPPRKPRRR